MLKLVIASNNSHKVKEISAMLPSGIQLVSLQEISCFDDIPEEAPTLEGNAFEKANYIFKKFGFACFADDTGLEVDALDGLPGVRSARFSEDTDPDISKEQRGHANMNKLLNLMNDKTNRKAAFRTVICFIDEKGKDFYFEGKIKGFIIKEKKGNEGFGYDPIFQPLGFDKTFAEMPFELKNEISHRALATRKFLEYMRNYAAKQ